MRKIPTVYLRDLQNRSKVTDEVNPECQWVLDGEGVPTRKYDGTCVMLDEDGEWWARREVKPGKIPPQGFVQVNFDEVTGKAMGWEPIGQSSFAKAFATVAEAPVLPGTYELCGPKVQGDPEDFRRHVLVHHSTAQRVDSAVDMDGLTPKMLVREVAHLGWEGIVWHWPQPDGTVKMAKLKVRDL
jgi:hypothetical protein